MIQEKTLIKFEKINEKEFYEILIKEKVRIKENYFHYKIVGNSPRLYNIQEIVLTNREMIKKLIISYMDFTEGKHLSPYPPHIFGEPDIHYYHDEDIFYYYLIANKKEYELIDITIEGRFTLTRDLNEIINATKENRMILQIKDFIGL
jgi:5-deoxy-D-glucuronate isomerase